MNNIIHEWITKRRLIETLMRYPGREFTVNELSKISKTPYATTWRFAKRADKTGLMLCRVVGHSFVCQLNSESPLLKEIYKLLEVKTSPQQAVVDGFLKMVRRLRGVDKVILFGSVARGEEKMGSDVDVALIVERKNKDMERKITDISDTIAKQSRIIIIPLILTKWELDENKQFKKELEGGIVLYDRHKRS